MFTFSCTACGIDNTNAAKCFACGTEPTGTAKLTAKLAKLRDELTNELTAFRTFAEFAAAMRTGYVPSIYASRGPKYVRLIRAVRAAGFRVYDGVKVS